MRLRHTAQPLTHPARYFPCRAIWKSKRESHKQARREQRAVEHRQLSRHSNCQPTLPGNLQALEASISKLRTNQGWTQAGTDYAPLPLHPRPRPRVVPPCFHGDGVSIAGRKFVLTLPHPAPPIPLATQHPDESVDRCGLSLRHAPQGASYTTMANEDMLPCSTPSLTTTATRPFPPLIGMKAEFITASRTKILPPTRTSLPPFSHPRGPKARLAHSDSHPAGRPKGTVSTKAVDVFQRAPFSARAVEPHSTQAGFYVLDINGTTSATRALFSHGPAQCPGG